MAGKLEDCMLLRGLLSSPDQDIFPVHFGIMEEMLQSQFYLDMPPK
jgi:hypothetical protein